MHPFYENKKNINLQKKTNLLKFPLHINEALECMIVKKGSCTAYSDETAYLLEEGDLFVSFPAQIRGYIDSTVTQWYQIGIPMAPYLKDFRKILTEWKPICPLLKKGQWEHTGIMELLEMAADDPYRNDTMVKQGYCLTLLAKLMLVLKLKPNEVGETGVLHQVIRYIDENYTRNINRKDVARTVGYNISYLSMVFSQTMHMGISEYIRMIRLDNAVHLLITTNATVTEIALNTGFGSLRAFNRVFRNQYGLSPTEYRKNYKQIQ